MASSPTSDLEPSAVTATVAGRSRRLNAVTYVVAAAVPLLALAWMAAHWASVDAGTRLLGSAPRGWFVAAFAVAAMTWVAGAVCQQGAVVEPLPRGRLLAVQFAGSAANHILPAGLGVATVNLQFLRHRGLSRASALNAVGLNTGAGITVHLLALTALICSGLAAPSALIGRGLLALIAAGVIATVALAVWSAPRLRRRCHEVLGAQLRSARAQWGLVGRQPVRAVQLWAGSAAVPVLHAITLSCITQALGAPIGVGAVFGVYFLASTVSAAVPSPGGFGSLDAALIVALSAGGLSTATAIAAVLAYRLITVWLPLLPSACALGLLRHRGVI